MLLHSRRSTGEKSWQKLFFAMKSKIKKFVLYGSIAAYVLFFVKFCVLPFFPSRLYLDLDRFWGDTPVDAVLHINLADVTSFEWDTMYHYMSDYPLDSIYKFHGKDLGFTESRISEGRLVFTKHGEVTYSVELDCYVEENSRTLFFTPDSLNWVKSCDDSYFELRRAGSPFMLQPLSPLQQKKPRLPQ